MKKVTILGSCVTRDAFEIISNNYEIDYYFARTSFISLVSSPIEIKKNEILLQSNFQKNCVYNDVNKSFFKDITMKQSDWLIIDLIDERFNLLQFNDSYVTKSNELVASNLFNDKGCKEIKRGKESLDIWKKAADKFFSMLLEIYPVSKIILHKTYWRENYYDTKGNEQVFEGILNGIRNHNFLLNEYYDYIEGKYPNIKVIDMTNTPYFSSEDHKWGLSPYHFEHKYYSDFIDILNKITNEYICNYNLVKTKIGSVNLLNSYDEKLTYLDSATASNIINSKNIKFDAKGIPLIKIGSKGQYGYQYYPITIGLYGLECVSKFHLTGYQEFKTKFLSICDYFVETQEIDGSWHVNFDYYYGVSESGVCKSPWKSALAQGFTISCLVRAYHLTKKENYLKAAKLGAKPFQTDVESGGVRRKLFNTFVFYEEYPTEKPTHILNGFMFSLLGLYELYKTTDDQTIKSLFEEGYNTLVNTISMYDLGQISAYDLTHITLPGNPSKYHYGYHLTHVKLLSAFLCINNDSVLERVKDRWLTYADGNKSCFRLETSKIDIEINSNKQKQYFIKNKKNKLSIHYSIDEELEYAFYVYVNGERIMVRGYSDSNHINIEANEENYQVTVFVRDVFGNTISKELSILVVEESEIGVNNNGDFTKMLDELSSVVIKGNTLHVTVGEKLFPHLKFAYYVKFENEFIYKGWYSNNQTFQYVLVESGGYSVSIFCLDLAGNKFIVQKNVYKD